MSADDRSRSPVNARLDAGRNPSKKAVESAEFVATEMPVAQSNVDNAFSCPPSRDLHGLRDFCGLDGDTCGRQMVFIELCAGSAVLSAVAQRHGYRVLPVDCKRNRHKPRCRIVSLDLAEDHAWEVLEYIVSTCDVAAVHLAPPCGTCSKARGIPMPDGTPGPQPLRSDDYLLGVPDMSPSDRVKVDAANRLYERMGRFIEWLDARGIAWVVENPTNSFLWQLGYFAYAVAHGHFAHCHACAFGSERPKKTSFLSNRKNILMMQRFCEDVEPHEHAPWGVSADGGFATALEAQYPDAMCEQLVKFVDELCVEKGVKLMPSSLQQPRAHKQPKGRATPQLVPEYEQVVSLLLHEMPALDKKHCLQSPCKHVPVGSKLLRSEKKGKMFLCIFGIFHSCEKFVQVAKSLWHPFDEAAHMPDHLLRCLFEHLTRSPMDIVKMRIHRLKRWTTWPRELSKDEATYKSTLDSRVRAVLGSKRLLLMQKVAEDIGWPDTELFKELALGFRLVGNATKSNVFQQGLKAATISEEQLMRDAKFLKPALLGKIRAGGGGEHAKELYDVTLAEASDKAWLKGPFTPTEVDRRFDGRWLPVRRFPVVQKGKLRPIDDLRENRVNDAFSSTERATLYALDHLVWASIFLMRLYKCGGPFSFTLSDGTVLEGCVHPEWTVNVTDLRITAMDLKSAYKQLPLSPLDFDKSVVSLWSAEERDVRCFECHVLPFGASASVHNFLRISAFLQAAGCYLGIIWMSYFDDFPMLSHGLHVGSTLACAKGLMSLFGFVYSEEKLQPFARSSEILGVVFDLSRSAEGCVAISNKPSRVEELDDALVKILSDKFVIPTSMPSVLGKLQYADLHVWGRAGRLALADLRELGHTSPARVPLEDSQLKAFRVLKDRLCSGRPKTFVADDMQRPVLIFTDGALEYDGDVPKATIGGVCLRPDGECEVFGAAVPDRVLKSWQEGGKIHVIGLVELYACVVSLLHWKPDVASRRVILFVDNWPALDVLVKGTSLQREWRDLLLLLEDPLEDNFMLWVARVPSASNVADHPSRGPTKELEFLKPFKSVEPLCPMTKLLLESTIC